jgi:hypothetical protein
MQKEIGVLPVYSIIIVLHYCIKMGSFPEVLVFFPNRFQMSASDHSLLRQL